MAPAESKKLRFKYEDPEEAGIYRTGHWRERSSL